MVNFEPLPRLMNRVESFRYDRLEAAGRFGEALVEQELTAKVQQLFLDVIAPASCTMIRNAE